MLPEDLPPPILVEDQEGLEELLDDLEDQKEIAFDTEADSFYSYRNKVCLIQVTVEDRDYLVDPLADVDISELGGVLADPDRVKIFHDGEYDVLILKRDFGFEFASLFDTRVAAAVLGSETPGLASVLESHFGVKLDKSMQRSDWAKRPLTDKQVSYARLDTHYLIELFHQQARKLDDMDRTHIVESECRRLETLVPPDLEFVADEFVRIKGARGLSPHERRALRELFALRDELARDQDVPPFRVMGNPVLLELARRQPRDARNMTQIKGFTPRMARRFGDRVLDVLEDAADMDPIKRMPKARKRDGTEVLDELGLELYDRLKRWRKSVSEELGVESAYLVNRHVLIGIAVGRPRDEADLEEVPGIQDWQLDDYADDVLDVVERFERDEKAGKIQTRRRWR